MITADSWTRGLTIATIFTWAISLGAFLLVKISDSNTRSSKTARKTSKK